MSDASEDLSIHDTMSQSANWDDSDLIEALRDALDRAEYDYQHVREVLGTPSLNVPHETKESVWRRRTEAPKPIHTLIRFFLIGLPVEVQALGSALAPMRLEELESLGLIDISTPVGDIDESIRASLQIAPWRGLLIAADRLPIHGSRLTPDHVMGVGTSTETLSNLSINIPGGQVLDLGSGCGALALHAADGADRVWAVDSNLRAVRLAGFNAALNRVTNIECIESDLYESVLGRQFDLIISNPPFVISPERQYAYRDGGMESDELSRRVIREAAPLLKEGGFCQVLCNWAHVTGTDWQTRLKEWFDGAGCDAWVLRCETQPVEVYAETWIRHTELGGDVEMPERFDTWMQYYESQGIEAVSGGVITLRKRGAARNWFHIEDAPARMVGPCGVYVERAFKLRDFIAAASNNDELLAQTFQTAPELVMESSMTPDDGSWTMQQTRVTLSQGLAWTGTLDNFIGAIVAHAVKPQTLGQLIAAAATATGVDINRIPVETLESVRKLVGYGMLLPVHRT